MGPWAPVAGAVAGLLVGLLVVLLLGGVAEAFRERLALVFLTVGLGMLGAAGALLADEVRLVRRGAREAGIRPAWVEATRSEEHTSELQSRQYLVCRLLLEKKKTHHNQRHP